MFPSTASRPNRQGYLAALFGSLAGAVAGVFVAAFIAAAAFGVMGLLGRVPLELQPLALLVPLGAVLGCGAALRAGAHRGAVATSLLLLGFIGAWGIAQAVWYPVEGAALWAFRSGLLLLLALLVCAARGLYLWISKLAGPEHVGRRKGQPQQATHAQETKPGVWITQQRITQQK